MDTSADFPGINHSHAMTYQVLNHSRSLTARQRIVAALTQEILDNPETQPFAIASEHQLCRRFDVSRTTVRLALGDLENKGLIFRKQGKGTFAHGCLARIHRHIGVLLKSHQSAENRPLVEFLRGVQSVMRPLRSGIILIDQSPEEWRPELASILAGVIVMPKEVTTKELENLKDRNLPFLIVGTSELPGPCILLNQEGEENFYSPASFFTAGQLAAETLNLAALTGEPVNESISSILNLSAPASCRHLNVTLFR